MIRTTLRTVGQVDASTATRVSAARSLIRLADSEAYVATVLRTITPTSPPELATGLLEAIGSSRAPQTGATMLAAWKNFTPAARRSAIAQSLRRPEWSNALLDTVVKGDLLRSDLGPQQWQQLVQSSQPKLAARAREVRDQRAGPSADREAVITKFQGAATKTGNAFRGKEVFTANCAVCHKMEGVGQNVGPDLSGIGARPKTEILTEILDPNRSVEANYRLWNVTTKDGETLAGRLDGETTTSIELLDLTGQRHVLQRAAVVGLESSNQSIMPAGFESLGETDLAALLEYLAAAKH